MPTAIAPSDKKEAPPVWKRMGLAAPEELLLWAPHGYLDFSTPHYAFPEANTGKRLFACLVNGHRMFDKDGFPTSSMRQARRLVISVKDHWGNAAEIPVFGNVWDWKDAIQQQELYLYAETDFFNNRLLASATLDRLRHNAYCMVLDGASYRAPRTAAGSVKSTPAKAAK